MSMVEEALVKAKELRTRVLETVDAFRPKLLVKKPLAQIKLLGQERLAGEGVGTLVNRIQSRIQEIRSRVGLSGMEVLAPETESASEVSAQYVVESKKERGKYGIHY